MQLIGLWNPLGAYMQTYVQIHQRSVCYTRRERFFVDDLFLAMQYLLQTYNPHFHYVRRAISPIKLKFFLGVIIDDKLKWNLHILYMKNKIAKSNGILYKIRNFLDRKTLSHLYNSFVFPYLIYGIEVWGNTNAVHLDPIIKIQKKIVRTITFSHYLAHTEPIFDTLNILNFNNLVVHRISLMMFKYSKDLVPLPIVELFTRNYEFHNHFTRQSQSLHTAVGRNEAIYKTFTFHGIRIWNYISTKISVDVSYASFKHSSKLFIKNNPIPYRVT